MWKTGAVLRGIDINDAEQLYSLIGLLIIEGRVPVTNSKGRTIGPHAHKLVHNDQHTCDNSPLCQRASAYRDQLNKFGRHGITLSICVELLPECCHFTNNNNTTTTNTTTTTTTNTTSTPPPTPPPTVPNDNGFVLEEWCIALRTKQSNETKVEPVQALLQTVTSYLHFSLLSSWMMRYEGRRPTNVIYRLGVYNDNNNRLQRPFYRQCEFPFIRCGEASMLHVTCQAYQPRGGDTETPPQAPCHYCQPTLSFPLGPATLSHNSTTTTTTTRRPTTITCGLSQPAINSSITTSSSTTTNTIPFLPPPQSPYSFCELVKSPLALCPSSSSSSGSSGSSSITSSSSAIITAGPPPPAALASGAVYTDGGILVSSTTSSSSSAIVGDLKEVTPFPREGFEHLDDVILRFSRLSAGSEVLPGGLRKTFSSTVPSCATPPTPSPRVTPTPMKQHRERSILFSDSSSNESLDRLSQRSGAKIYYHSHPPPPPSSLLPTTTTTTTTSASNCSIQNTNVNNSPPPPPSSSSTASQQQQQCGESGDVVSASSPGIIGLSSFREENGVLRRRFPSSSSSSYSSSSAFSATASVFNPHTHLPLRSSPAPVKRNSSGRFEESLELSDYLLGTLSSIKKASSVQQNDEEENGIEISSPILHNQHSIPTSATTTQSDRRNCRQSAVKYSTSAPAGLHSTSSHNLIINFEESMLAGRIPPLGEVEGFRLDIGANNVAVSHKHVCLPLQTYFFQLTDDHAPSPYLGYVDLSQHLADKRGYRLPKKGTLQLTLFNPSNHVVKVFVVLYDFHDMPPNNSTFLRQRTLYMPVGRREYNNCDMTTTTTNTNKSNNNNNISTTRQQQQQQFSPTLSPTAVVRSSSPFYLPMTSSSPSSYVESIPTTEYNSFPVYLRYLLHLRFQSSRTGRIYLHKDIRIIFSQDKFEFDSSLRYDLQSFIDLPSPRYCSKR